MKKPDEIKKGIECCYAMDCACLKRGCPYNGMRLCHDYVLKDALAYIQQLEEENKRTMSCYDAAVCESADLASMLPKWISVKERLPEHWHMDDKDRTLINYLVYSPEYGVDVGNYVKPAKRWVCMGLPMNVTHWMSLPKPPEVDAH